MMPPAVLDEAPVTQRGFDEFLRQAIAFHGHLCPGLILGVRMAQAGCREIGLDQPRSAGKALVVFVEIDRCATDAIQIVTGVSLGKRTLKHMDYGKMAATFVNASKGAAVRVLARDEARHLAGDWALDESDPRRAQTAAYRIMPEAELFRIEPVVVHAGWLDRRRVRVLCQSCREGVNYQREMSVDGRTLCRPCGGERYYTLREF
jgi:formylmethanofuran dehydrogenase subunit E